MQNASAYHGEIERSQMLDLLTACRQGEWWLPGFEQYLEDKAYRNKIKAYALNEGRAGWWPLLNIRPNWKVLDLGCGWGPLSIALARKVAHVTASDLCFERLQFLRLRTQQEGFLNIQLI